MKDPAVQLLKQLVEIDSGTYNRAGVTDVQGVVAVKLKEMGFSVVVNPAPKDHPYGPLVVGVFGKPSDFQTGYIDFVMHADTVFELEAGFSGFKIQTAKGTATGPGVIDDKGGIVVALRALDRYLATVKSPLAIRVISSPCEEIGSPGFLGHLKQLAQDSQFVLGFEPSLENGSIVHSRKGNLWYDIKVVGKEAHAGRDPWKGVNAAHELALKLGELQKLNSERDEVSLSTGQISGGTKFNIVCGEASAKVDLRFPTFPTREEARKKVEQILATPSLKPNQLGELPKVSYEVVNDCPPFEKNPEVDPFIDFYLAQIKALEKRKIGSVHGGGAADSNNMSRPGLLILDGLGPTGGGMHRKDEWVSLDSLQSRADAACELLNFLSTSMQTK